MEAYIGSVALFAFNYVPEGWLPCDGRLLPAQTYPALYSLLGNEYGGEEGVNFALPDMAPVPSTNGPALQYCICAIGIFPMKV
jgi:microcystin-dependent protein